MGWIDEIIWNFVKSENVKIFNRSEAPFCVPDSDLKPVKLR